MTIRRHLILLLASLALSAPAVRADEALLGLESALQVDSNLFKTSTGEVRDGNIEISPNVMLRRRDDDKFVYTLYYRPSYDVYFRSSEVNGVDHFLRATGEYNPTRIDTTFLRLNFTDYRSVRAADAPTDGIPDVVGGAPGRVNRLFADLGWNREWNRLTRLETTLGLQNYGFDTPNNVDSTGVGGDVALRHRPTRLIDVGLGLFASYRRYHEQLTQPASQNVVVNPNLLLTIEPIETLIIDVRAGPAWIHTTQSGGGDATVSRYRAGTVDGQTFGAAFDPTCVPDTGGPPQISLCPIIAAPALAGLVDEQTVVGFPTGSRPADIDDSDVTALAIATITKTEDWGSVQAEYYRRENAAAGTGSTTIRDSVTGTISVHPGYRIDVRTRVNWNRRQSLTGVNRALVQAGASTIATGDGRFFAQSVALIPSFEPNDFQIEQLWADVVVGRPFFLDAVRIEGRFRYLQQKRPDQPIVGTFDDYFGEIRVIYSFQAFGY